jgi:integrase
MKLSATILDEEIANTLTHSLKDRVIWDSTVPGLGARITPKGKVSFILMYRFQGRLRKLTMGRYGRVTINQARDQARVHFGEIMQGIDPGLKKKELRTGMLMKELCEEYIKRHAVKKRSARDDIRMIAKRIIPTFGNRRIQTITYQEILRFHRSIKASSHANRYLSLLSKMYALAKEWGYVESNFVNPAVGISKNPEKARNRYVREDEMPRLLKAIHAVEDPYVKGAILISLFTGIRQGSVLNLRWEDIDLEAQILLETKAKTAKAGEVFRHPISAAAVDIFRSIPRREGEPFVFRTGKTAKSQSNLLRKVWTDIKLEAGIKEAPGDKLWLHDLRRTVGSWLVKNNYSTNIAKAALNHKSLVAAQRYQHISDGDVVRLAMEDITQKMIAGKKTPSSEAPAS